ncbi:MAG: undecaprenyl-phosphate glucose phosphotransferase [Magnetospirillum sp.]|nr:undecaprenyl-phosphate glucose phosphotransferase [Magnetospirillum sp.]
MLRAVLLTVGRLIEGLTVAAAGLSAPLLAGGAMPQPLAVAGVALLAAHALAAAGLYEAEAGYGRRRTVLASAFLTFLVVPPAASLAAWLGGEPPPPLLAWAVLAALGVAAARPAFALALARLARWGQTARRVLVIGDRTRALEALSLIAGDERRWAFPVGICLDRDPPAKALFGGFVAGLDEAERMVRDEDVDDVIVAVPWTDTARLSDCLSVLRPLTVDVHLFPETPAPFMDGNGLSVLGGVPMARIATRPLSGWRVLVKAAEDRVLGALLLALVSPLLAAVALAIKLDSPGPVFFRQSRYGYDNRPFTCFKFRSMVNRPEELQVRQATRDDPRVTRVGRLLRRTSLDELPQLINVVNGTMSLVGPRPHAVSHHHHYARLVDDYRCRHRMKPGITGWAQINGYRGETATVELMRKRVIHDLWYIDHWSLGLDLMILARTPLACLKATNAY